MKRFAILVPLGLALAACGHSSRSTEPTHAPSLTGAYEGPSVFGGHTYTLHIDVVQTGTAASGTYASTSGDRGTFAGNIVGTQFSAVLISLVRGVRCNSTGTIRGDSSAFSGTLVCSNRGLGSFDVSRV